MIRNGMGRRSGTRAALPALLACVLLSMGLLHAGILAKAADPVAADPVGADPVGVDPVGVDPVGVDGIGVDRARAVQGSAAANAAPQETGAHGATDPGAAAALRNPALAIGEQLTYSVRYGVIKAGTATLQIAGLVRVGGRVALQIVSTAASNAVFDKIYPVRDRVLSLMDADSLYSHYFEKHLREGGYQADQSVRFDQRRGIATYQNGKEYAIDPGTCDVLAAFYKVRTMPLHVGDVFYLNSHTDKKNYPLRVNVLGREKVDTPLGRFSCLVVEPRLKSGAFFKNEGRLTIYLTEDERRIPVLMRSKIPVGSISVVLTDVSRPDSASGPATTGSAGAPREKE